MSVKRKGITKNTEYTVSYSGMRGVDLSTVDGRTKRYRFSYLENMYKDYGGDGAGIIESIPGFRKIASLGKRIHAIYSHKNEHGELYIVVHSGKELYRFPASKLDSLGELSPVLTIADRKSTGFTFGNNLYILDGNDIACVDAYGNASYINDYEFTEPYVPVTYLNGEEYEQRNLLTERFYEKYMITSSSDLTVESEGVLYKVLSSEDGTVSVSGLQFGYGGVIYIPAYTYHSGKRYKVVEIGSYAFKSSYDLTGIIIPSTVTRIGAGAFSECERLTRVILSTGVEEIDNEAFYGCQSLSNLRLGRGIRKLGTDLFSGCSSLSELNYEGSYSEFLSVESETELSSFTVNYNVDYRTTVAEIPIHSPAKAIASVTVDGESVSFSTKLKDSLYTSVIIVVDDSSLLDGKEVIISGISDESRFTENSAGTNFISENGGFVSGKAAILGCTVCECFDGRVFLSGNPSLPNTVFYSSRDNTGKNNPLYFGIMNYFNDGTGFFPVRAMLAAGDSLAVFKAGDDGSGSIYYHTPRETGIGILPKIYPVSYVHSGIGALGGAISFFDDPIFLSPLGVCALDKKTINLERSIAVRSGNVNLKLLTEDLENASVTSWCGYLVIGTGENIYLADSREVFLNDEGLREYEWYFLTGIGTYSGARGVYKYSENETGGFAAHPTLANKKVEGEVFSTLTEGGEEVFYTVVDGVSCSVYTDGERQGGVFSPSCAVLGTEGDLLFFGTESGDVCVFNNDKRGIPAPYLAQAEDFDPEEYREYYKNRIHPYYYNFDDHAPRYALKTVSDDGGIPNFTKNTVKHSLVVKVRCLGNGEVSCEIGTEKGGYKEIAKLPDSALNFSELDFENLSFANLEYATLSLREKERGWLEKNIAFHSQKYSSPFGIYSILYRFTVKGKIKH